MNEHKKPRGNKAKNDKDSILADAKNLLYILHSAIQRMPKIERIEGAHQLQAHYDAKRNHCTGLVAVARLGHTPSMRRE